MEIKNSRKSAGVKFLNAWNKDTSQYEVLLL